MRNSKFKYSSIQSVQGDRNSLSSALVSSIWKSTEDEQHALLSTSYGQASGHAGNSIRNSAFSRSNAWCLRQFGWCVHCYETRFITIEPIIFIVMFAVYLHKIVFELYAFNRFARQKLPGSDAVSCVNTTTLNSAPSVEKIYHIDNLWSNKTGDVVESETALLNMMVNITSGICSLFSVLLIGPFSNYLGHKPALIVILAGMLFQAIITMIIIDAEIDLHFFVLGGALRGLTGGVAGLYTVSYSNVAELSRERKKWLIRRIELIEVLSFVAVSLGLLAGGLFGNVLGCQFSDLSYIILFCNCSAFFYALIATAESHDYVNATVANRSSLPQKEQKIQIGPKSFLLGIRIFLQKKSPRVKLLLSLLIMMITVINSTGFTAVIVLFLLHHPLVWTPTLIGIYLAASEFIHGVVLVIVLPLLLTARIHDEVIVSVSIFMTICMNIALAFVGQTWQVFIVGILQSFEALVVPTLKAMVSKVIEPEDKGALFSFITIVQVLSTILGYAIYIPVYTLSLSRGWPYKHSSGVAFLVMATAYILTVPFMCVLAALNKLDNRRKLEDDPLTAVDERSERSLSADTIQPKRSFDASIGQDIIVDKEDGMISSNEEKIIKKQNSDWLEQSYCSLSDHHTNKQ